MKGPLHSDGGARGHPGPAAIGFVLVVQDEVTVLHSEYIGKTTNKQAEYKALLGGMKRAKEKNVTTLECFLDSELVTKQLAGEYRIKNDNLRLLDNSTVVTLDVAGVGAGGGTATVSGGGATFVVKTTTVPGSVALNATASGLVPASGNFATEPDGITIRPVSSEERQFAFELDRDAYYDVDPAL